MSRFTKYFQLRLSPDMLRALDREARSRQQTLAEYARMALVGQLKRDGVRLHPLAKRKSPQLERHSTAVA